MVVPKRLKPVKLKPGIKTPAKKKQRGFVHTAKAVKMVNGLVVVETPGA